MIWISAPGDLEWCASRATRAQRCARSESALTARTRRVTCIIDGSPTSAHAKEMQRKLSVLGVSWGGLAPYTAACVDCPAGRVGSFEQIVAETAQMPCAFVKGQLAARAPLPLSWAERHAFVLVRRGVLVRHRADELGGAVATDCAGPGCFVSFPTELASADLGYAATELLVCLCPRDTAEHLVDSSPTATRDVVRGMSAAIDRIERFSHARAQSSATGRVAATLACVADTLAPPRRRATLPSGLQQRDLARLAGVRHESFCRALGELESRGLVKRSTDGIEILRHDELAAVA